MGPRVNGKQHRTEWYDDEECYCSSADAAGYPGSVPCGWCQAQIEDAEADEELEAVPALLSPLVY